MTNTDIPTEAPITISLDLEQFARHLVPDYDAPYDYEDGPAPKGALDGILSNVARIVAQGIVKEHIEAAVSTARSEVAAQVREIVQSVLDEGGVVGDGYSAKKTKPLRELIRDEVLSWTTKEHGDSYSRGGRQTALQLLVRTEVDKALKDDLRAIQEEEREKFRAAIRTSAASLLAAEALKGRG